MVCVIVEGMVSVSMVDEGDVFVVSWSDSRKVN